MTQTCIDTSAAQPQLFVIVQEFICEHSQDLREVANNLERNFQAQQEASWIKFWAEKGEKLILRQWNVKYKYYLNESGVTDCKDTRSAESETGRSDELSVDDDIELETVADKKENGDMEVYNATNWQRLWEQHTETVYRKQYRLFAAVCRNFFLDFKHSILTPASHENTEYSDAAVHDISSEIEQLSILGLPTNFGAQSQPRGKKSTASKRTFALLLFGEEDEADDEGASTKSDSTMGSANGDEVVDDGTALHKTGENAITKKKRGRGKKNRKLRNVPDFLLAEKGMLKYWRKRFSLFSRFDEGIRLDRESWFSVTPEKIAIHLAKRLACDVIVDGFCGCGGNAIQFARTCRRVIAIDIDPVKVEMAKSNASIYGVGDKIEFIVGDFLQLSATGRLCADNVFLSPPWGGPKYKNKQDYDVERFLLPVGATELMTKARNISKNVAIFLPRNSNVQQVIKLAGVGNQCEIEHNYLDTRLVAISALYGDDILKQPK